MVLARWQRSVVDDSGDVQASPSIEVRRESDNALATIYSDRAGTTPLGNPFTGATDGFAFFYAVGDAYKITATKGSFSRIERYVGIGLASESDGAAAGVTYLFSSSVTDATPGDGYFKFNNASPASATQLFIDEDAFGLVSMAGYIQSWDDNGVIGNRGTVFIQQNDGQAYFLGTVTGSVTDAGNYDKVIVTPVATFGTFVQDKKCSMLFTPRGAGGDVVGPASSTTGRIARYADGTGKLIEDSGVTITTVGTGRQTVYVPSTAWKKYPSQAGKPDSATNEFTTLNNCWDSHNYDPTSGEFTYFDILMPKGWDEGQITFAYEWSHPATTVNFGVVFQLAAHAVGNGDTLNFTLVNSTQQVDTGGTTDTEFLSPIPSPFTIGGSPAELDHVQFRLGRVVADAGDTMAVDARIHGVHIYFSTNANTDA